MFEGEQRRVADGEPELSDAPHPFTRDAIREMTERDLPGNSHQAHQAECPGSLLAAETDFDEITRLVDLDRIPAIHAAGITERQPPEARRAHRTRQRPVGARLSPGGHIANRTRVAIGREAHILRPAAHEKIE